MLHPSYRSLPKEIVFSTLLLVPALAYAEVSDKEPSSYYIWSVGAVAATVCFFGAYYRRWLLVLLAPPPALWFISLFLEIHSADVGAALYREQGLLYYLQAYLSLALFVLSGGVGWLLNKRRNNF